MAHDKHVLETEKELQKTKEALAYSREVLKYMTEQYKKLQTKEVQPTNILDIDTITQYAPSIATLLLKISGSANDAQQDVNGWGSLCKIAEHNISTKILDKPTIYNHDLYKMTLYEDNDDKITIIKINNNIIIITYTYKNKTIANFTHYEDCSYKYLQIHGYTFTFD